MQTATLSAIGDGMDPGFGVYVHWPFCAAKCPYCDFNSHVRHQPVDQPRFVAAFLKEMEEVRELSGPRTVTSVFMGGGTPSLMEPSTVDAILQGIARHWHVPDGIEITMEANPSSVEATRFHGYRAAGVNRVSLGVQALNDRDLKFLGRLHNVEDALKAIRLAREIFPRMSFDLIYARPNQTVEEWERELKEAVSYAVDHLSLYQLTIEEGTPFYGLHKAGKLIVPDGEQSAVLYEATQDITAAIGMPAYEVSNHARPGAESRHNLTYWRYGDYAGIGPGAHGRLGIGNGKIATSTERKPEEWLRLVETHGHGMIERESLDLEAQSDELLLMGLRLKEGVDLARWQTLSGRDPDPEREQFLIDHGFIERLGNSRLRCTPAGMLILDAVVADLACP
ncbi:radical SAM family heme chaperone HemW [Ensifer adhaerens]|jgi:putative oxygen-independent coproporphyrinogen III oxidase|uniref:Heme chaperone HemW n=1 Tax=Ensifer adhaerens TaxID=106592 RepID=A0A9Q8Y7Z1_ENSAD|nr:MULTISPECIES: radical SAM family heme chaperone HemW [Ensifer]KSV82597.1 coproporphyrinogen III oxidase [Sinorhizobium sp. GL2]MBD9492618.1 coproporphyrinogen III oxidase [Ensifer sp. ENS01]MBD9519997.1 coproporphyrinogen III oxidase [Ensifer sp. ENS02]MBD9555089.1 coproporphyrinogen III oxidase [Ensifer sp. ENS03]MBD9567677.1 coproporphyrinogen III oxidase [Ensifer sp. ENS08]